MIGRIPFGITFAVLGLILLYQCYHALYQSGETVQILALPGEFAESDRVDLEPGMNPMRAILSLDYELIRKPIATQKQELLSWTILMRDGDGAPVWTDGRTHYAPAEETERKGIHAGYGLGAPLADFEVQNPGAYYLEYRFEAHDARVISAQVELRREVKAMNVLDLTLGCVAFAVGMGVLFWREGSTNA